MVASCRRSNLSKCSKLEFRLEGVQSPAFQFTTALGGGFQLVGDGPPSIDSVW